MPTDATESGDGLASVVLGCRGEFLSHPMTVETYFRGYGSQLDARRFGEIYSFYGYLEFHGHDGKELLTREKAWLRRCRHGERRGMKTLRTMVISTDLPFIRCHM